MAVFAAFFWAVSEDVLWRGSGLVLGRWYRFDYTIAKGLTSAHAPQSGMIPRAMPNGDILGFAPPLVATRADVDQMVQITKEGRTTRWRARCCSWHVVGELRIHSFLREKK